MEKVQEVGRLALSVQETAAAVGVSSRTIRTLIKSGDLPHFRLGARVLVEVEALRQFVEERTKKGETDHV